MKKKILSILLILILIFSMASCGDEQQAEEEQGDLVIADLSGGIYAQLLQDIKAIFEGQEIDDIVGELSGAEIPFVIPTLAEILGEKALDEVGFVTMDLSGDGSPELLIGAINPETGGSDGGMLYALYTMDGKTPKLILDSSARNQWNFGEDGLLINTGSGGAIYSIFAGYTLSESGQDLVCQDFYYTYEIDGDFTNIGCYYNQNSEMTGDESERLADWTLDDFDAEQTKYMEKVSTDLALIPINSLQDTNLEMDSKTGPSTWNSDGIGSSEFQATIDDMKANNQICAVAFLGWFGSTWEYLPAYLEEQGYTEKYPYLVALTEEQFVMGEGDELYLIVPCSENASVAINQISEDNEIEAVLYRSDYGDPVVVQGNKGTYSDEGAAIYNLQVNITPDSSKSLTCYPGIDFDSAGLWSELPILDLMRAKLNELESVERGEIIGMWDGYITPDDGRASHYMYFEFYEDGGMYYLYSTYDKEFGDYTNSTVYRGTYKYKKFTDADKPASGYVFDLALDYEEDASQNAPKHINTIQYITTDMGGLAIQLVDGDHLFPNKWEYKAYLQSDMGPVG